MSRALHLEEHEEGLPNYLARLTQTPLLTAHQEEALTKRAQQGDPLARQRLIEANMRLVINIAKSYRNKAIPIEDLIQEGAIGLMQAAERFDPGRGFRFSTYATHWIRQAIGRAIDNKSKAIRIPAHVSQAIRRIERERTRISHEQGVEPTLDQLAECLEMTPAKLMQTLQCGQELLSLDMRLGENGGATLGGLLPDDRCENPEETVMMEESRRELRRIFAELNDRERAVMERRFRLDNEEPTQPDEVAREMNITRERVRQIELQAIKKLRAIAQARRMREMDEPLAG